ncbi:response regulator transcription factor [Ramlibacter sp. AN1133]|uniref:response regulator transcription factor n=1 Tax=Ramlibacter sp. AN1133 TaxID=3133429 RepID=UPI0030C26161
MLADGHPVVRCGLRRMIEGTHDLVVGAETGNGHAALELLRSRAWGLAVLDLWIPGRSGLELIKLIKAELPRLPILVFSAQSEEHYALRAIRAGASGYLAKDADPETILSAMRSIASGGVHFTQEVAALLSIDPSRRADAPPHTLLTDREYGIFDRIVRGHALTEIADDLSLSIKTISTHKSHILDKLNLHGHVDLVRYAIEHKLLDPTLE